MGYGSFLMDMSAVGFAKATLAKHVSKQGSLDTEYVEHDCRDKIRTIHESNMLIALGNGQIKWCKLKGANELLPNELNYEKRNTQVQVGGEGGADIRIVNCFVTVFLSFSLLAFTLAFPGFSAKERGQQRREMPERLKMKCKCALICKVLKTHPQ